MFLLRMFTLVACVFASGANADWQIVEASRIGFVSIKNNGLGENNNFTYLKGSISDLGEVSIDIHLSSVHTGVGIRDERLKTMLFDIVNFPVATIDAVLSDAQLQSLEKDGTKNETIEVKINLHGERVSKVVHLSVITSGDDIRVTTTQPTLITAQEFGLEPGVAALQEIAGLSAISRSIPVTVDLHLTAD